MRLEDQVHYTITIMNPKYFIYPRYLIGFNREKITMKTYELIKKSVDGEKLSVEELEYLLSLEPDSAESLLFLSEANRISNRSMSSPLRARASAASVFNPHTSESSRKIVRCLAVSMLSSFRSIALKHRTFTVRR